MVVQESKVSKYSKIAVFSNLPRGPCFENSKMAVVGLASLWLCDGAPSTTEAGRWGSPMVAQESKVSKYSKIAVFSNLPMGPCFENSNMAVVGLTFSPKREKQTGCGQLPHQVRTTPTPGADNPPKT